MSEKPTNIFEIAVHLRDTEIWRTIQIPEKYTFFQLHLAIQNAMGWENIKPHFFQLNNLRTGVKGIVYLPPKNIGLRFKNLFPEDTGEISRYFSLPEDKATYVYGTKVRWFHDVILKNIIPASPEEKDYPECTGGGMLCPPDDDSCGGVLQYKALLEIVSNPNHLDYRKTVEWYGEDIIKLSQPFDHNSVVFYHFWNP